MTAAKLTPRQLEMLTLLTKRDMWWAEGLREHVTANSLANRGLIYMGPSSEIGITDAGREAIRPSDKAGTP